MVHDRRRRDACRRSDVRSALVLFSPQSRPLSSFLRPPMHTMLTFVPSCIVCATQSQLPHPSRFRNLHRAHSLRLPSPFRHGSLVGEEASWSYRLGSTWRANSVPASRFQQGREWGRRERRVGIRRGSQGRANKTRRCRRQVDRNLPRKGSGSRRSTILLRGPDSEGSTSQLYLCC